jgi:hypothetical protein
MQFHPSSPKAALIHSHGLTDYRETRLIIHISCRGCYRKASFDHIRIRTYFLLIDIIISLVRRYAKLEEMLYDIYIDVCVPDDVPYFSGTQDFQLSVHIASREIKIEFKPCEGRADIFCQFFIIINSFRENGFAPVESRQQFGYLSSYDVHQASVMVHH